MLAFIILLVIAIISYIMFIKNKTEKIIVSIGQKKDDIDTLLNERFKIFQHLIQHLSEITNYEDTIFKDIVLLRSVAQANKIKENTSAQFEAEGKISKIINKIETLLEQYPTLNQIQDIENIKEKLINEEKKLLQLKEDYNQTIFQYKKNLNNIPNNWIILLFKNNLKINPVVWSKNFS